MTDTPTPQPERITLRGLPLSARLVLSAFLISTGIGYGSALVQLHFQHAKPGSLMPDPEDAERIFNGKGDRPRSKLEVLLEADETLPFTGDGQMRAAFTTKSDKWKTNRKARMSRVPDPAVEEKKLLAERDGERMAVLEWLRAGASKADYDKDEFCLSAEQAEKPITSEYVSVEKPGTIKIKSILTDRCVRCHMVNGDDPKAAQFPLDAFKMLKPHVTVKESTAMSLTKLAQTTHVHLLGFSMLYGLTGLILAFSSYPGWLRVLLCPLPLVAQVVDISCWWLARFDPMYAHVIMYTGGIVALGLMLHIVLSLLNMYGIAGKLILLLMFAGAAGGGYVLKTQIVDPYLESEKGAAAPQEP